jgi:hypothetical protein
MEPVQLTKEHLDALHNLESEFDLIQREINRMAEAGLDTTVIQRQFDEMRKVREGLLKVYGGVTRRRTVA